MTMLLSKHAIRHHTTGISSRLSLASFAQFALICCIAVVMTTTVVQAQEDVATSASINCFYGNGALSNKTYGEWYDAIVGAASPIYTRPEFEDYIDANATGELGAFGHCSRTINGNLLGLAYVCQAETSDGGEDCLCLAEYNGTVCSTCTMCNTSAPAEQANFEADCTNVNGECKIECGHAAGATSPDTGADLSPFEDSNEVCPYPATSPATDPSAPAPAPSTSNAAPVGNKQQSTLAVLVLTTALFWIY